MIVAIHQPNFLPWLGYFHKMQQVDLFVYLDSVQFTKDGYQNRARIKTSQGPQWLTVPVLTGGRFGQRTADVEIDRRAPFARKHMATLAQSYGRTRGWPAVRAAIAPVLEETTWTHLVPLNLALIECLRTLLGIRNRTALASTLEVEGESTELLLSICKAVGATGYLSGRGALKYMSAARFAEEGVELRFQEFRHPVYQQPHGDFVAGLSALDLLCAEGADAAALMNR